MEFHDYPPTWKSYVSAMGLKGSEDECVAQIINFLGSERKFWNSVMQIKGEVNWKKHKRPYYDLYPGIAQAFTKINLEKVMCQHLTLPLPELLIRLPVGHEIKGQKRSIKSILALQTESKEHDCPGWLLSIHDGSTEKFNNIYVPVHSVCGISLVPNTHIAERLASGRANPYCDDEMDDSEVDAAVRIVTAICMLKNDENLIEPLPLAADLEKWERTHDPLLLEKAEKRGKRGWAVGKQIELTPTFRRPHFAIRWCGKGGNDPRLRPIKGCIVFRDKAKEIPTGYLSNGTN